MKLNPWALCHCCGRNFNLTPGMQRSTQDLKWCRDCYAEFLKLEALLWGQPSNDPTFGIAYWIKKETPMNPAPILLTHEVTSAINGEFSYQRSLCGTERVDTKDHGIEGQLVLLRVYLQKAEETWVTHTSATGGKEATLDIMRKIAAIAARALVLYGCPRREGF